MTASTLPRTKSPATTRLTEVNRELGEIAHAFKRAGRGWHEQLQDSQRVLRLEKADLLGALGRTDERLALLAELALEA